LYESAARGLEIEELDLGRKLSMRTALYDVLRFPMARRRLDQLMRTSPTDELFVLQYKWEQLLWGGRHIGERVILWEHGPIPKNVLKLSWSRNRLRSAYREARAVFAMSEPARRSVIALAQVDPPLLPAGLDLDACAQARIARNGTRADLDLGADTQVLGFVGRVTEDKGILQAIAVLEQMPHAVLLVCGEGHAHSPAQRLALERGVASRVRWLGWRDDALQIIAAVDAIVLLSTSHGEGRPLVALEALAVGTPVIGLLGTPALDTLADEPGVYLARNLESVEVHTAIRDALARPRPEPSGEDWDVSVARFLGAMQSELVESET
jgi:glycosyltransferase involved in cell wall biosynthesis